MTWFMAQAAEQAAIEYEEEEDLDEEEEDRGSLAMLGHALECVDASGGMVATADRCGVLCVWELAKGSLRPVAHVPQLNGGATYVRGLVITETGGTNVAGRCLVYSTRDGLLGRVAPHLDDGLEKVPSPEKVCVRIRGAARLNRSLQRADHCDGVFEHDGERSGRPCFTNVRGQGALYWAPDSKANLLGGGYWKLCRDGVGPSSGGWNFSQHARLLTEPGAAVLPPAGEWTAERRIPQEYGVEYGFEVEVLRAAEAEAALAAARPAGGSAPPCTVLQAG